MITGLYTRPRAAASSPRAVSAADASDEALVRRIAAGDRLAMQTLFARHRTCVYRWLLRLIADEATAEDLLSDVFLDVWRHADRFQARSSVSTWLLSIARFKALSARRRRRPDELSESVVEGIADLADDPEAALLKKDRGALLREALRALSAEHAEVIDLAYYHEKSVDEIAGILAIPAATVKTRMHYARKKLAELVAKETVGGDARRASLALTA